MSCKYQVCGEADCLSQTTVGVLQMSQRLCSTVSQFSVTSDPNASSLLSIVFKRPGVAGTALHLGLSKYLTAQDTRSTPFLTEHNRTLARLGYLVSLQPRSTIKEFFFLPVPRIF